MSRTTPRALRLSLLFTALVGVCALAATGCTSDSGGGSTTSKKTTTTGDGSSTTRAPIDPNSIDGGNNAYTKALIPLISRSAGLTGADADAAGKCLAPKWVKIIDLKGFAKAGVAPEDFAKEDVGLDVLGVNEKQAKAMVKGFKTCGIDVRAAALAEIAKGGTVPKDKQSCVEAAITQASVEQGLIANLLGKDPDPNEFAAVQKCFAPS